MSIPRRGQDPVPADLTATIDLPPVPRSVPAARRVLAHLLSAWSVEPLRENAELLVSELVTNVVRHVGGPAALRVRVRLAASALRVAVADGSPDTPARVAPSPAGGYGLPLVAALADRWGVETEPGTGGKRVWFELNRPVR